MKKEKASSYYTKVQKSQVEKAKGEMQNKTVASLEDEFLTATFKKTQEDKIPVQIVETCFNQVLSAKHI